MAIRLSLGAGRSRLAALLMTESLILGLGGGVGGLVLAWWFAEFMAALPLPLAVPLAFDVGLDGRVVGFALVLSLGAAIVFGLAPALRASRPDLVGALKRESTSGGRRRGRLGLRNLLVLGQVAASVVLLIPAGLFLRTVREGTQSDVGFDPDRVAILWKVVGEEDRSPEGAVRFFRDLEERLLGLPGVEDVELARRADASVMDLADRAVLDIPGFESPDGRPVIHSYSSITPGFVEMMDLPLIRGRGFTEADGPGAPPVALVNEAFVRRYWPGRTGLGETFSILERREVDSPEPAPATVVRVVGVIRDTEPGIPGARQGPFLWIPYFQDYPSRAVIHLKGRTSAAEMVPLLREEVPLAPGETPLIPAQTYETAIRGRFLGQEIASHLLSWAGLFAMALAVMGIYGIVTFAVSQRVREMAIRQAVGARRQEVLRSLIWEGMFVAGIGLVLGLALATTLALLIRSQLFGIAPLDPLVMVGSTGLLAVVVLLAALVPSLRAVRTDPMAVLREE
jgi:predicted permease